jgi:hypothetical protein
LTTRRSRAEFHLLLGDIETRLDLCAPTHDRPQAERPLHVICLLQYPSKPLPKCSHYQATATATCSRPRRSPGREQGLAGTTAQRRSNHPRPWGNVRIQCVPPSPYCPNLLSLYKIAGSSGQYSVFPDDYRVPFLKRKLAGVPEGLFQYFTGA